MSTIIEEIRVELRRRRNPIGVEKAKRFFKEPIDTLGLSTPETREVTKLFYPRLRSDLPLALEVGGELHSSGVLEEAGVAVGLVRCMRRSLRPEHFNVFDDWVDHLTNWANTDSLCCDLISETVRLDPSLAKRLLGWTASENRWRRRAAAVSMVPIVRRGGMLDEAFSVADRLMEDRDEMVQKGVGWMLKEASKSHPEEVRAYLLRWRERTPALVLRYASEKLPVEKRVLKTKHYSS
jgi:3-methyladenine DNA glycosylase AlkD